MAAGYGKGDAMVRKAQSMIEPGVMDIRKGKTGAPVNPVPPAVVRQRRDIARMAKVNPPPPGYKKGGAVKKMKDGGTSKESSADMKQDKAVVRTAVHKHERAMHQGKPMTKLKKGGAAKSPCAAYKPKKMAAGGAAKERKGFPKVSRTKLTNAI